MGVTVVTCFTLRKEGIIEGVIVHLSHSSSVILITVVTKAPRPVPVAVNVGTLPRDPGLQGVLSVVGTVHTV